MLTKFNWNNAKQREREKERVIENEKKMREIIGWKIISFSDKATIFFLQISEIWKMAWNRSIFDNRTMKGKWKTKKERERQTEKEKKDDIPQRYKEIFQKSVFANFRLIFIYDFSPFFFFVLIYFATNFVPIVKNNLFIYAAKQFEEINFVLLRNIFNCFSFCNK